MYVAVVGVINGPSDLVCELGSLDLRLDRADTVVLVLDGVVVATGRHRELLRDDPRYRSVVTREEVTSP